MIKRKRQPETILTNALIRRLAFYGYKIKKWPALHGQAITDFHRFLRKLNILKPAKLKVYIKVKGIQSICRNV